jgi:hypothetical protein
VMSLPLFGTLRRLLLCSLTAVCLLAVVQPALLLATAEAKVTSTVVKKPAVLMPVTASGAPIVLNSSLELVRQPQAYLNKTVTFEGEFRAFSGLGLDYKPALRESKEFVTLLVRRPDVTQRTIPLSELKLFYPRKKTEALTKLEPGAKVRFTGKVFSTALGDPWLELSSIEVTQAAPKKPSKEEAAKP